MVKGKIHMLHVKKDLMVIDEWRYSQLKHFVTSLPQPVRSVENLRPFERLCTAVGTKRGISRIYKVLVGLKGLEIPPFIVKWEEELGKQEKDQDVGKILN